MNTPTRQLQSGLGRICHRTLASLVLAVLSVLVLCAPRASAETPECWDQLEIVYHPPVFEYIWCDPIGHWETHEETEIICYDGDEDCIEVVFVYEIWVEDSPGSWNEVEIIPGWEEVISVTVCV